MPDGLSIDDSEILELAADLAKVPEGAGRGIVQAVEVSSRNIKDSWRDALKGSETVPLGPNAITYDLHGMASGSLALGGSSSVVGEIGPSLDSAQGPIVGILEEGSATETPRGFGAHALAEELVGFEAGLAKAVGDVL